MQARGGYEDPSPDLQRYRSVGKMSGILKILTLLRRMTLGVAAKFLICPQNTGGAACSIAVADSLFVID